MRDDERPDYRRTRASALQQLANGGDLDAVRELERRGVERTAAVDVTTLEDRALRVLVAAWNDGTMPAERERNRATAELAQAELMVRFQVDSRRYTGRGAPPIVPVVPPWFTPRPARCAAWQRPAGSTLYPSDPDRAAAQIGELGRHVNRDRQP